jgi:lipoprotein-anchoring transpeptidase ErfK/SrfK
MLTKISWPMAYIRLNRSLHARLFIFCGIALWLSSCTPPPSKVIVSVCDQRLGYYHNGNLYKTYPISTSKYGVGSDPGSYRTPLGRHQIIEKIGDNLPAGAVLKNRKWTGEILPPNAPGRDPIVSRILRLNGKEKHNANSYQRYIYIHGTPEEQNLGYPASYGCIRMSMNDMIELYAWVDRGAWMEIVPGHLPPINQ